MRLGGLLGALVVHVARPGPRFSHPTPRAHIWASAFPPTPSSHAAGVDAELEADQVRSNVLTRAARIGEGAAEAMRKEERKKRALEKEAEQASQSEELAQRAELIIANLATMKERQTGDGGRHIRVQDWTEVDADGNPAERVVVIDAGYSSAREWAEAAFKKARRMRRGSAALVPLIEQSTRAIAALDELVARAAGAAEVSGDGLAEAVSTLESRARKLGVEVPAADDDDADADRRGGARRGDGRAKVGTAGRAPTTGRGSSLREWTGRRFLSPGGVPILVGRNKRENEQLSLVIARHPDVWMHVREAPGAHVVLQLSRNAKGKHGEPEPEDECVQMAANLAAFYSDLRHERKALVTLASPKYLWKPKGAPPGAIGVRQVHGSHVAFPMDVPEECKEARAQAPDDWGETRVGDRAGASGAEAPTGGGRKRKGSKRKRG